MLSLVLILLATLAVSFLCSVLEASLMSTPISYITMREEEGYKPAKRFKKFKTESSRPIAAILSLNTIANTMGAAAVGGRASVIFGSSGVGVVSAITTVLILVFSEIIPKTIGTSYWKSLMGFTTACLSVLVVIMFPIVIIVEQITKLIAPKNAEVTVSRDEVAAMAGVAEEEGDLEEDENTMIQNIINMDEVKANEIMTPRVVCAIAPERMTLREFHHDERFGHHSRIPVYSDSDEYITGYILRMEALQLMADDKFDRTLGSIRRDITSFPEDKPLDEIWDEMLSKDEQIAIVIDEYGSFQGILSLEDIIETVLGSEIVDEQDTVRDMQQLARDRWTTAQRKAAALAAKRVAGNAAKDKPAAPPSEEMQQS